MIPRYCCILKNRYRFYDFFLLKCNFILQESETRHAMLGIELVERCTTGFRVTVIWLANHPGDTPCVFSFVWVHGTVSFLGLQP
jgi:hypothetical protein